MISPLALTSGAILVSPHGLDIQGTLSLEDWKSLIGSLQSIRHAYHNALADAINYGHRTFGSEVVGTTLEQLEFDMSDANKAINIGTLSYHFRQAHPLTSEHYHVLATCAEEQHREKWAKLATDEKLTALELKRSIEKGEVIRTSEIQKLSGHGAGINTVQGVVFQFKQWENRIGGVQAALKLPEKERRDLLSHLTPMIELAAALESSLSNE